MTSFDYVQKKLDTVEILLQLAEEAAELGHAALKLRRAIYSKNPTPVSIEDATNNLIEEVGDVMNCLRLMPFSKEDCNLIDSQASEKMERWARRLETVR